MIVVTGHAGSQPLAMQPFHFVLSNQLPSTLYTALVDSVDRWLPWADPPSRWSIRTSSRSSNEWRGSCQLSLHHYPHYRPHTHKSLGPDLVLSPEKFPRRLISRCFSANLCCRWFFLDRWEASTKQGNANTQTQTKIQTHTDERHTDTNTDIDRWEVPTKYNTQIQTQTNESSQPSRLM